MKKWLKMDEQLSYTLTFLAFFATLKNEINDMQYMDEKLRLYSLTFLPFFPLFSKMKRLAKMGEKFRLLPYFSAILLPLFQK
jgi:predicted component of viral defense system (DUF524 family)